MKRNLLYFAILVVLCVVAYFTLIRDPRTSYSKKDADFAIQDTTDIGRIVMTTLTGDTIDLRNANGKWTFNEGLPTRPDAIHNLLRTLHQLEVKVPVAKSMHNTVVKSIAGRRTLVRIYDHSGELIKGFYIGENTDKLNGTFMLMEDSDIPFVVNIPGFAGYVSTVFFTNKTDWRSKEIFSFKPTEIRQIDITYPQVKDSTFSLVRQANNTFILVGNQVSSKPVNQEIVQFYLKQFQMLNAEYYIEEADKRDSLLHAQAACIMSVTGNNDTHRTLKIYYRPITYRSKMQYTYKNQPVQFDLDKYYGVFNNDNDLAIIQNFVFGKLLVGPQFFYRQKPGGRNVLIEEALK